MYNNKSTVGMVLHESINTYLASGRISVNTEVHHLDYKATAGTHKYIQAVEKHWEQIGKFFDIDSSEKWISKHKRIDAVLKRRSDGVFFIAEWKFRFNSGGVYYRVSDAEQLCRYLKGLKHIKYGLLCVFNPFGDVIYYVTDGVDRIELSTKLSDNLLNKYS